MKFAVMVLAVLGAMLVSAWLGFGMLATTALCVVVAIISVK